jgi:hypothetical protein
MAPSEGTYRSESILTGLHNLHLSVGSNLARGSFARSAAWALRGLADMHAAQLMERIEPALTAALSHEWTVLGYAQSLSGTIESLHGLPRPDSVRTHPLRDSELGELEGHLREAFSLLGTVTPGEDGRDESLRAAEWLELPADGLADNRGGGRGSAGSGGSGGTADAQDVDWDNIDWDAVHGANQRVCKDASSSERLAFLSLGHLVLIGPDHPQDLLEAVARHPSVGSGTVRVRSARVGAGSMEVEGCPPEHMEGFEWAIAQFSRKTVEFI